MAFENYYTIPKLAKETGFSADWIRRACNRAKAYGPIPHVKSGNRCLITMSDFIAWLGEEKLREA